MGYFFTFSSWIETNASAYCLNLKVAIGLVLELAFTEEFIDIWLKTFVELSRSSNLL